MKAQVVRTSRRTFSDSTFYVSQVLHENRIALSYKEDRELLLESLADFHPRPEEAGRLLWDITGPVGWSKALQVPLGAVNNVVESIWSVERPQPQPKPFHIGPVSQFLRERLIKIKEVDAIFLRSDPDFVHIWTVVVRPSKAEDKVYAIYKDCLFKYTEIPFDFVVLYRRNLPELTPPDQAIILYRKESANARRARAS